jgi:protein TonB
MRQKGIITIPQILGTGYGALELKRSYQKHLGLAVIIAGILHVTVIHGFLTYSDAHTQLPKPIRTIVINDPIGIIPPPPISRTQTTQIPVDTRHMAPISLGIAAVVPDEEAPGDAMLASQEDLGRLSDRSVEDILAEGGMDSVVIGVLPEKHIPERGEYVYRDEEPVALNQVPYKYPALALQAGIEGTVWIEALVDNEGNVRDA